MPVRNEPPESNDGPARSVVELGRKPLGRSRSPAGWLPRFTQLPRLSRLLRPSQLLRFRRLSHFAPSAQAPQSPRSAWSAWSALIRHVTLGVLTPECVFCGPSLPAWPHPRATRCEGGYHYALPEVRRAATPARMAALRPRLALMPFSRAEPGGRGLASAVRNDDRRGPAGFRNGSGALAGHDFTSRVAERRPEPGLSGLGIFWRLRPYTRGKFGRLAGGLEFRREAAPTRAAVLGVTRERDRVHPAEGARVPQNADGRPDGVSFRLGRPLAPCAVLSVRSLRSAGNFWNARGEPTRIYEALQESLNYRIFITPIACNYVNSGRHSPCLNY